MDNYQVAELLEDTAKLMELHGENPFKIRSYQSAAFKIERQKLKLEGMSADELAALDGIGKSLSQKIHQLLTTGSFNERDELLRSTPEGVRELMTIKGIGPKKVALLWKELDISSPGELLYACNENRLVELKGFGEKTQDSIAASVIFRISQRGLFHYATASRSAEEFLRKTQLKGITSLTITGELRRKCEVISHLEFLCNSNELSAVEDILNDNAAAGYQQPATNDGLLVSVCPAGIPIKIYPTTETNHTQKLWETTGNELHLLQCRELLPSAGIQETVFATENDIYKAMGIAFIEPEMREGINEIAHAVKGTLPVNLIEMADLKGVLHNHSTYSDGLHTLEEMAIACKDAGYEYLGICDHSRSAGYAGGLSIERVKEQQEEIKRLNEQLAPFRIFSGIESDILPDGSLDYPDEILASFDLIVASVHSGLKMDKEKATQRLLTAIRNPYTTILGHPTGRLLLSREGYPIDHDLILQTCAEQGVVVELNAHPYRLDLDWRWIEKAVEYGVLISINPDAHSIEGFEDMYYGVCVARKAMLTPENTFNAKNREVINDWFKKRKEKRVP